MALTDDLKNAASMLRKAGQDSQTMLQSLQQLVNVAKSEMDQLQTLINNTQTEINNFEQLAKQFDQQSQLADEVQKRTQ